MLAAVTDLDGSLPLGSRVQFPEAASGSRFIASNRGITMANENRGEQSTLAAGGEENDAEPPYRVGDHVTDREEEETKPMLVVGIPGYLAREYRVEGANKTVAELNEEYPKADEVVEAVFVQRTDTDLDNLKRYAYPASRLKHRNSVHPSDEEENEQ